MIKTRPLIVCGMGRSGTRMCANILNNSTDVELQGEIGGAAGTKMVAWLDTTRRQRRDDQVEKTYALARAAFRLGSAGRPLERPDARWFGHKTPRHERHFARYESIFNDPDNRAVYVYCLRNPFDVWRSYRVMPWNKFPDATAFVRAWVKSVKIYEAMKLSAPGRVLTFHLDDLLASPDRLSHLEPNLLGPLNISPETFIRPIESLKNSNSAVMKVGIVPEPLSDADRAVIGFDRDIRRMLDDHFPDMDLTDLATLTTPRRSLAQVSGDLRRGARKVLKGIGRRLA